MAVSVALLGSDVSGSELLGRALLTGLAIGLAQALAFRLDAALPITHTVIWIVAISLGWTLGWFITRSVGVDLGPKWTVFGSTGAWAFQLLTGLALYWLRTSASN